VRVYEVMDERQRFVCLRITDEPPIGIVLKTHTYSSAYYNALGGMDSKDAKDILLRKTDLEYKIRTK